MDGGDLIEGVHRRHGAARAQRVGEARENRADARAEQIVAQTVVDGARFRGDVGQAD